MSVDSSPAGSTGEQQVSQTPVLPTPPHPSHCLCGKSTKESRQKGSLQTDLWEEEGFQRVGDVQGRVKGREPRAVPGGQFTVGRLEVCRGLWSRGLVSEQSCSLPKRTAAPHGEEAASRGALARKEMPSSFGARPP